MAAPRYRRISEFGELRYIRNPPLARDAGKCCRRRAAAVKLGFGLLAIVAARLPAETLGLTMQRQLPPALQT